jgi:hypothetical protein
MTSEPVPSLYLLPSEDIPLEAVLDRLAGVPQRLRSMTGSVSVEALGARPGPDEWSAFEAICHMRDAALIYGLRFQWIALEDAPFLPNYDEDRWAELTTETPGDVPQMVDEMATARSGLMRMLSRLPAEAWSRTGRHEVLGEVELEPYVRHQLAHEEMHLEQVAATLAG